MLDAKYVRDHLDEVAENMANRHASFDADEFTALDEARRAAIAAEEALQTDRNRISKEIGSLMAAGKREEAEAAKESVRASTSSWKLPVPSARRRMRPWEALMMAIPNLTDATTPVGEDEDDNPEVRRWGTRATSPPRALRPRPTGIWGRPSTSSTSSAV